MPFSQESAQNALYVLAYNIFCQSIRSCGKKSYMKYKAQQFTACNHECFGSHVVISTCCIER